MTKRFRLVLLSLVLLVPGCAFWQGTAKPAIRTANEIAAGILCGEVFGEKYGMDWKKARDIYCDSQAVLEPFLAAVEQAKLSAAPVAIKRHESEEEAE